MNPTPRPVKISKDAPVSQELTSDQLVRELLEHRTKDRRSGYIKTGAIGIMIAAYIGVTWMLTGSLLPSASAPATPFAAVVEVKGVIGPNESASNERLRPLLQKAFESPQSKGVILQINSPGGTPVQSGLIYDTILEFKQKYKKPVIAVGEDSMTSGAYFIASAADKIVVNPATITGSIGVISAGFGFTDIMRKLGIDRRVVTAGDSKNLGDPFSPETTEMVKTKEVLLANIHTYFIDSVKAGRGEVLKTETPGIFQGAVWTGNDAIGVGLADELGSVHTAASRHLETDQVIVLKPKRPLMDSLLDGISLKASQLILSSGPAVPLLQPAE